MRLFGTVQTFPHSFPHRKVAALRVHKGTKEQAKLTDVFPPTMKMAMLGYAGLISLLDIY